MNLLAVLILLGSGGVTDPPTLSEDEGLWFQEDTPVERNDQEDPNPYRGRSADSFWEKASLSATVVYTSWDDGIALDDSAGLQLDVRVETWRRMYVQLGILGWNTENDLDEGALVEEDVRVLGILLGLGYRFGTERIFIDIGLGSGLKKYESDVDDDNAPYVRLQVGAGVKISRVEIGLMFMADHEKTSFNRGSTHLFHHYSGAASIGFRF